MDVEGEYFCTAKNNYGRSKHPFQFHIHSLKEEEEVFFRWSLFSAVVCSSLLLFLLFLCLFSFRHTSSRTRRRNSSSLSKSLPPPEEEQRSSSHGQVKRSQLEGDSSFLFFFSLLSMFVLRSSLKRRDTQQWSNFSSPLEHSSTLHFLFSPAMAFLSLSLCQCSIFRLELKKNLQSEVPFKCWEISLLKSENSK